MTNALTTLNVQLPSLGTDELGALAEVAKGSNFLPRLQLITKGKFVDTGKIAPGHWGVPSGDDIQDLGDKIDIIPFAFRPKAMDVSDREAIVTTYDNTDPEFKRISTAPKNTGCIWGPTFLVFERSTAKFYELFLSNASGRKEAANMRPFLPTADNDGMPSPATLGIRYKSTKDYGWHVPVISKCSTTFEDLPSGDVILEEINKFMTQTGGVEKVTEEETKSSGRAR